jgi:hypothetical protein
MLCSKNLYAYDVVLHHGVTAISDESLSELFDQSPSVALCLVIKATSEWTTSFSSTIYFLHASSPPSPRWNKTYTYVVLLATCSHPGSLFGLLFDPEDEGNMFLRKVNWLSLDYTALYPGGQNSSYAPL